MYIKIYTLSIPRPCSVSVQQKRFYQHFLFFASTLCGKQSSNINISFSFTQIQKLLRFYGFCSPLNSTTAFQLYTLQHMQNTKKASNAGSVAGVWLVILMTIVWELHKVDSVSSYSIHYSCTPAHMQTLELKPVSLHLSNHTMSYQTIIGSNQHQDISVSYQDNIFYHWIKHFSLFFATRCHHKLRHIIEIYLLNRR